MHRSSTLLLVVLLLTLCGCTGPPTDRRAPPASAAPAATPAPAWAPAAPAPLDLTRADLLAALPATTDLFPWRVQIRCSARAACTRLDDGSGHAGYVSAYGERSREVPETLLVAGIRWRDSERALSAVTSVRTASQEDYGGRFAREPEPVSDDGGYRYGERGRGRVTPLETHGWSGFRREVTSRFEHLDGRTSARFRSVFLYRGRDRYTVQVAAVRTLVRAPGRARDGETARAQADAQLEALLDRLEGLGHSGGAVP